MAVTINHFIDQRALRDLSMLKLHFKDNRHPALWVVEKRYHIGSASENHLVLAEPGIDPVHAKLVQENNKYFLKDNNSSTGSFVNGRRVTQKEVLPGDMIRLGNTEIIVLDPRSAADRPSSLLTGPWRLVSESNWLSGKHFIISPDKPMILGRDEKCDIVIPGSHLSRRHLEIRVDGHALKIKDLKSANGTFLNEMKIDTATAGNGDRLRLDVYNFRVVAPELNEEKTRLRKPVEELVRPIERKEISKDPKRWKTRPTSPGNRVEPTYNEQKKQQFMMIALLIIAIGIIATALLW
jgi:pSer/pThr/pTyr-binding forkhead associated (FHA) protein